MRDEDVTCDYCGAPYHGVCTSCHRPGESYEYRGQTYNGLTPYKGERLCHRCRDERTEHEGIDILAIDDRPSIPDYVVNTVRDRDVVHIWLPPELRGYDGRDRTPRLTRGKRKARHSG